MASSESSGDIGRLASLGLFRLGLPPRSSLSLQFQSQLTQFIRCNPVLQVNAVCLCSGIHGDVKWVNYETHYAHLLAL